MGYPSSKNLQIPSKFEGFSKYLAIIRRLGNQFPNPLAVSWFFEDEADDYAEAVEDSTRIELQRFSTQRETQSASVPLDQVDRQRFAERFDLKADRRLAGAQFGGRLRQAPARATPRNERSWR